LCWRHTAHGGARLWLNVPLMHTRQIRRRTVNRRDANLVLQSIIAVSPWRRNCTCHCRSASDSRDKSQLKCHNCSCGKRDVKNLRRYRKRINTYQPDCAQNCFMDIKWIYNAALRMLVSLQRIVLYTYFTRNSEQRLICLLETSRLLKLKCVGKVIVLGPKLYNILEWLFKKQSHDRQLVRELLFKKQSHDRELVRELL
jgi:hypothetical protein